MMKFEAASQEEATRQLASTIPDGRVCMAMSGELTVLRNTNA